MTSSNDLPRFRPLEFAGVCAFLIAAVSFAALYFYLHGYLLYYGDAQAHLNISRSILDSRTPGYDQLGTVWLPLLHLICIPFVQSKWLWSSGLAATIPVAFCFVVAGLCLYYGGAEAYKTRAAAMVVVLCFALNPNVLYLASIPMTEIVFIASLSGFVLALLRFRRSQSQGYLFAGLAAIWLMSLTRYDGWFLIPFAGLAMGYCAKRKRAMVAVVFCALASAAPLYWMAHNWWETGNGLDFYNGPYSPAVIQGGKPYPGDHDWTTAFRYYFEAARLCCGNGLIVLGAIGLICAVWQKRFLACGVLLLTPAFYVWSMHSSRGSPIFLPTLWPHGYYNSRYGIAAEVACAFAAGAIVGRFRMIAPILIALIALIPWMLPGSSEKWICWKESQKNSAARRAWTSEGAAFFRREYRTGDGILTEFGDLAGIFGAAEIPLAETLHEGNGPLFLANTDGMRIVRQCKWAVAQAGDKLSREIAETSSYQMIQSIEMPGGARFGNFQAKEFEGIDLTEIPFTKLHGAENDFLLTWSREVSVSDLPEVARRICARTTGVGADGWMLLWPQAGGLRTRLFNADGSEAEISGNGTRCAAAFALLQELVSADEVVITTVAGPKHLRLTSRRQSNFEFEMDMGLPRLQELHAKLSLAGKDWDATILNVGNPQCALFVSALPDDWRVAAAEAEAHGRFPKRSNVSVVRVADRHTVEAVFFERGAGETRSSGTGSTGAAAAAILRGEADSPVEIQTQAGSLHLRWDESVYLTGPAELVCEGMYFLDL